ncbi:hypothetical protein C9374_014657 [Naegleria lovaniensis]|uniref:Rhodanese domain-containing protein n=1 Tax=Naegleria lovaniensis TaxID=51637 RepID=A0AA88GUS3_NAELO|nr:uncharacterized protein C9374_014657 [Naegleria lovaniensis]KAG2389257.1 hypothetical protein C9374_014657 [Naegleria lovaniensis]
MTTNTTNSTNTSTAPSSSEEPSWFSSPWWWTFGSVPEIDSDTLHQLVQSKPEPPPQIIDVRTETEYQEGHIEGSLNCSFLPNVFSFSSRMEQMKLDPSRPVYAICLSAHRSIAAVKWLSRNGYNAFQLKGGMQEWRRMNKPEVK